MYLKKSMINKMNFEKLIENINNAHSELQQKATSAVNKYLTIRNCLVGYYIVEQSGQDRAKYGEKLIENISKKLKGNIFSQRRLRLYRQFYLTYPQVNNLIIDKYNQENLSTQIRQSVIAKLKNQEK